MIVKRKFPLPVIHHIRRSVPCAFPQPVLMGFANVLVDAVNPALQDGEVSLGRVRASINPKHTSFTEWLTVL
jgi:hypothetical protein